MFKTDNLIIGGGVTGLTLAYQLQKKNQRFVLVDSNFGGQIQTEKANEFTLENGPNVILAREEFLNLISELGLESELVYPQYDHYLQMVWNQDQAVIVPKHPIRLLKSHLLSPVDKLRLLFKAVLKNQLKFSEDDVSILDFFSRIFPKRFVMQVIDPALKGVYGGAVKTLSARTVFPVFYQAMQEGQSIFSYLKANKKNKPPKICMLKSGNQKLVEKLYSSLNVDNIANDWIKQIKPSEFAFVVKGLQTNYQAKNVFITTSGFKTARMFQSFLPELLDDLGQLNYSSLAFVHCETEALTTYPENAFGVMFPEKEAKGFLGIMFNSNLFPHMAPRNTNLVTLSFGGVGQEKLDLDEIINQVPDVLEKLNIKKKKILSAVFWPKAICQYELGHHKLQRKIKYVEQEYPGLRFVGTDMGRVGVSDRIKAAVEASTTAF